MLTVFPLLPFIKSIRWNKALALQYRLFPHCLFEYTLKKRVSNSITGTYWYRQLRGYEIDDNDTKLRMAGRQWILRKSTHYTELLRSYLAFLCETTGIKVRYRNIEARGICVWAMVMVSIGRVNACISPASTLTRKYTAGQWSYSTNGLVVPLSQPWDCIAMDLNHRRRVS